MPHSSLNDFFQGWLDKAILLAIFVPSPICYVENSDFMLTIFACKRLKNFFFEKKKDGVMVLSFLVYTYTDRTLAVLLP